MKFYFSNSKSKEAIEAKEYLVSKYGQNQPEDADIIVPIGGDGFMLKNLHDFHQLSKPFFGINCGSVGFLMNAKNDEDLEILKDSKINIFPIYSFRKKSKYKIINIFKSYIR